MSDKEKAEFTKDIELALFKKWWPYVTGFGSVILLSITITWWFAHNIATTSDTDKIVAKVEALTQKFDNMPKTYISTEQAYSTGKIIHERIDSLGRITTLIQHSTLTSWQDKYGNTHFRTND